MEIELTPEKVWLIRKAAETCLNSGDPGRAISLADQGLALKSDDERLRELKAEAEKAREKSED